MKNNKYELMASNSKGASIILRGGTISEVLSDFDFIYNRSGFIIRIYSDNGYCKCIKNTFR